MGGPPGQYAELVQGWPSPSVCLFRTRQRQLGERLQCRGLDLWRGEARCVVRPGVWGTAQLQELSPPYTGGPSAPLASYPSCRWNSIGASLTQAGPEAPRTPGTLGSQCLQTDRTVQKGPELMAMYRREGGTAVGLQMPYLLSRHGAM